MKKLICCVASILLLLSCSAERLPDITYEVSPASDDEGALLKVVMRFKAEPDGTTSLLFQNKAWGQDSLHQVIASMKVLDSEAEIAKNGDVGYIVSHPIALDTLELEYLLKQDTKGRLTTKNDFRPVINDDYFHVYSHSLFMLPEPLVAGDDARFNVGIHWEGFPQEESIINSFGSKERAQFLEDISEGDFHSAIFVGGDYRENSFDLSGNKVVLAIRGDWEVFTDEEMTSILSKTIAVQRDFWEDHSQEFFLVTMTPTFQEQGSSFHGTGLTQSFALTASNNSHLEVEGLTYLMNHELQHNWTGKLIQNENEEEQYWFSEGFTEYYSFKNIARNEIYGLDKSYFMKEFNRLMTNLYTSPVSEAPNSEINYENFWSDFQYSKLPYRRGALFAFYLDHKIKKDSQGKHSLDDVMLKIKRDALKHGQKLTHPYFVETANAYLKEDLSSFFETHIIQGQPIDLAAMYDSFDFEYEPTTEVFDLGFKLSEDRKSVVTVDNPSPAYDAGIRKGDQLGSFGYMPDNSNFPVDIEILRNGEKLSLQYYPKGKMELPQLLFSSHNEDVISF